MAVQHYLSPVASNPVAMKLIEVDDGINGGGGADYVTVRQYHVRWLSELFHAFPHVNLSFQLVDPTFDPYSTSYQESLMFLASLPVLWMLLTMLIFIVYFCYMCYHTDDDDKKRKSTKCQRWTIAIFVVLTCGCAGVGLYGNEEVARGMEAFTNSVASESSDWDNAIKSISSTVGGLRKTLNNTEARGLQKLESLFERGTFNTTINTKFKEYTSTTMKYFLTVKEMTGNIEREVSQIPTVGRSVKNAKDYEFYRWIGTLGLLCFFLLVCLIYLCAVAKGSKCLIIFCTCVGVFCLILSWTVIGIYLASAVAVGDFCVNPNQFVQREANGKVNIEVLHYYMNCTKDITSPFSAELKEAHDGISTANRTIRDLDRFMAPLMSRLQNRKVRGALRALRKGITRSVRYIQRLTSLVSCFSLHESYITALEGICYTGLAGIAFLLLANMAVALLITIVILLASVLWRRLGDRKSYSTVDADDDPSAPQPHSPSYHRYGSLNDVVAAYPSAHHASLDRTGGRFSPPSLRMGSTRHTGPEHLPMKGTHTPPPAYGDYYDDYGHHGTLSSTLGSRGRRDPDGPVQV